MPDDDPRLPPPLALALPVKTPVTEETRPPIAVVAFLPAQADAAALAAGLQLWSSGKRCERQVWRWHLLHVAVLDVVSFSLQPARQHFFFSLPLPWCPPPAPLPPAAFAVDLPCGFLHSDAK